MSYRHIIKNHTTITLTLHQKLKVKKLIYCKTTSFVDLQFSLKQEYETRTLPPIKFRQFSGNPMDWLEYVENFHSRVHSKTTLDDNLRMERLCSVLDREAVLQKQYEKVDGFMRLH